MAAVAHIAVTLEPPSTETTTVDYMTVDGTAIAVAGDYTAISGSLTFAPGDTSKIVNVPIGNQEAGTVSKYFSLRLFNATGGAAFSSDDGICTINAV